jgi:hypothetical protein
MPDQPTLPDLEEKVREVIRTTAAPLAASRPRHPQVGCSSSATAEWFAFERSENPSRLSKPWVGKVRPCPPTSTSCARSTRTGNAATSVAPTGRTPTSSSSAERPSAGGGPAWPDWRKDGATGCVLGKTRSAEVEDYRELDDEQVLVLNGFTGRSKSSGLAVEQTEPKGVSLFHIRNGTVTRLVAYAQRDDVFADLGLED